MTGDLFEDLREAIGCTYISDIRLDGNRLQAILVASSFSHENYSKKQWDDISHYLRCPSDMFNEKRSK